MHDPTSFWFTFSFCFRELKKEKLNGRLFLQPIIEAERDRRCQQIFLGVLLIFFVFHRFLRAMKAFEAEEALIMKDVPGWKVGESPYILDKWVEPIRDQLKFPPGEDIY